MDRAVLEYVKKRQQALPPKKRAKSAPAKTHLAEDRITGARSRLERKSKAVKSDAVTASNEHNISNKSNEYNKYLVEALEYAKKRQEASASAKRHNKQMASKADVRRAV